MNDKFYSNLSDHSFIKKIRDKKIGLEKESLRVNSGIFLPKSQTGDESKTILFSKKMKHYISYFILFPMFN